MRQEWQRRSSRACGARRSRWPCSSWLLSWEQHLGWFGSNIRSRLFFYTDRRSADLGSRAATLGARGFMRTENSYKPASFALQLGTQCHSIGMYRVTERTSRAVTAFKFDAAGCATGDRSPSPRCLFGGAAIDVAWRRRLNQVQPGPANACVSHRRPDAADTNDFGGLSFGATL